MMNNNFCRSQAILFAMSALIAACGSDGGKTVQLKSSANQRAQTGKDQGKAREKADRTADASINRNNPDLQRVTIRTGAARTSSMDGNNWSAIQANQNAITANTASSNPNNNSMYVMGGIALLALFGKDLMEGGASLASSAKGAIKEALAPNAPAAKSNPSGATVAQQTGSTADSPTANAPSPTVQPAVQTTTAGEAVKGPGGNGYITRGAAAGPKGDNNQKELKLSQSSQCPPDQNSNLGSVRSFFNDVMKKTSNSGVKS